MNFVDEILFGEFCKDDCFDHLYKTIFLKLSTKKMTKYINKICIQVTQCIITIKKCINIKVC